MKQVEVSILRNTDYFYFMLEAVRTADERVWAAVFSMNLNFLNDTNLKVRDFAKELIAAQHRGVDVRVLLSGESVEYNAFRVANEMANDYLTSRGIEVRRYGSTDKRQSHSKYVIVDDGWVILGSHNWSPRSFALGRDDSVALRSTELNRRVTATFVNDWSQGKVSHVS
jgi:phosphatidylserine/phosphatidylglycerophosphate/cardiolipin synthase-like enzyme